MNTAMNAYVGLIPATVAFVAVTAAAWVVLAYTDWLEGSIAFAPVYGMMAFLIVRIAIGLWEPFRGRQG